MEQPLTLIRVSEVCLLILTFLKDEKFKETYEIFSKECHNIVKSLLKSQTKSVKSLLSILNEYLILKEEKRRRDQFINSMALSTKLSPNDELYDKIHTSLNSIYNIVDDYSRYKNAKAQSIKQSDELDVSELFTSTTLKRKKTDNNTQPSTNIATTSTNNSNNINNVTSSTTTNTNTGNNDFLPPQPVNSNSKRNRGSVVDAIRANSNTNNSNNRPTPILAAPIPTLTASTKTNTPKQNETSRRKNMTPKKLSTSPNNVNNNNNNNSNLNNFSQFTPVISLGSLNNTIASNSYNTATFMNTSSGSGGSGSNSLMTSSIEGDFGKSFEEMLNNPNLHEKLADLINNQLINNSSSNNQNQNEILIPTTTTNTALNASITTDFTNTNTDNNNNWNNNMNFDNMDYVIPQTPTTVSNSNINVDNILMSIESDPEFERLYHGLNHMDNNNMTSMTTMDIGNSTNTLVSSAISPLNHLEDTTTHIPGSGRRRVPLNFSSPNKFPLITPNKSTSPQLVNKTITPPIIPSSTSLKQITESTKIAPIFSQTNNNYVVGKENNNDNLPKTDIITTTISLGKIEPNSNSNSKTAVTTTEPIKIDEVDVDQFLDTLEYN